jgi:hypothetical protein
MDELNLVMQALIKLQNENPQWSTNRITWSRMSETSRELWWYRAQQQAAKGVHSMQTLVLKVIELRLRK